MKQNAITVEAHINARIEKVWDYWTQPSHIVNWNNASPEWHCPKSENDLREGGKFSATMAARDGSFSFDFGGTYDVVELYTKIAYTLGDGRQVEVHFTQNGNSTQLKEIFDPEGSNPLEVQQGGWQAILNNFKAYAEKTAR